MLFKYSDRHKKITAGQNPSKKNGMQWRMKKNEETKNRKQENAKSNHDQQKVFVIHIDPIKIRDFLVENEDELFE